MANEFIRKPIDNGDLDNWATYANRQIENTYGVNTCQLYNDAGTLKITKGIIGIEDGTNNGTSVIDTITSISIAGVSNSNWAQIEMAVSGTTVTIAATDIAGATTQSSPPATFMNAYNPEKGGYYINSTKRTIGIIYKDGSGNLAEIVNTFSNDEGFTDMGFLHIVEQQATGGNGGTFTSGAWQTRLINTIRKNYLSGASLASNQITLPAGEYYIEWNATAYDVQTHKSRVYNTTDTATILVGSNGGINAGTGSNIMDQSIGSGKFTLPAAKVIELQHRCFITQATSGFGLQQGWGEIEVYSEVKIWKRK